MTSNQKNLDPLENFTDQQIADLGESIDTLDQEERRIIQEKLEEAERQQSLKKPFRRLRASPFEILNRSLFFICLGSFLFSFISIYAVSRLWLFLYITSIISCILYTPNRKALKELLDALPNIADLIKGRGKPR